jgi:putative inorganic carbon (hco3(-)) transporter
LPYFLFLLVTATLFIRPSEIIPAVFGWPIYEYLIIACLLLSLPRVFRQFSLESLRDNPVTACVLGLLAAVVLSHLSHFDTWSARMSGLMFLKLAIYYLLLVAVVDSPKRLMSFLGWLLLFIAMIGALSLLNWRGVLQLPGMEPLEQTVCDDTSDEASVLVRMRGTGIFNDPNDLAMILVAGVVIGMHFAMHSTRRILRPFCLALVGLFGFAIFLTQSRGGLLALVTAGLVFFYDRWGVKRTAILAAVVLPLLLVAFGGRMTSFGEAIEADTGQSRVQLWSEGLILFRQFPLFGVGCQSSSDEIGMVIHNSFIHAFTELGFLGGSLFLGAFAGSLVMLYRLVRQTTGQEAEGLRPVLHCVIAILAGVSVAMLSLSRCYVAPTYLPLGLATVCVQAGTAASAPVPLQVNSRVLGRLAVASVAFLVSAYVFVRISIHR